MAASITQRSLRTQHHIFGRLEGLVEAWGSTRSEWTEEQARRLREVYVLLNAQFVVHVFSVGFPSEQIFLKELGAELFNDGIL